MSTMQDNAQRVKRFRQLKATLRTDRARLLVSLDIAQAAHVAQLRHAHTRIVAPALPIPNTTRGFAVLWARIQQAQRATGCRETVMSARRPALLGTISRIRRARSLPLGLGFAPLPNL